MRGLRLVPFALAAAVATSSAQAQPSVPPVDPASPPVDAAGQPIDAEQPPAPVKDPKVAKKWLDAAATLMKKGDAATKAGKTADAKTSYDNAVIAYGKAIETSDDVALHLQLALAIEKSGDIAGAIKEVKLVVAAQGVKPDVTKKAQAKLDELTGKVGFVTLAVTPDGSAIAIDGAQVGEAPMSEPVMLMPGTHTLTATAVGYQPKDMELKVEAGSESERKLDLEPIPVVTKAPEAEPIPEKPAANPASPMLPLYIGGGVTAALLVTTAVSGLVAVNLHGKYEDATDLALRDDYATRGKHWALATDIFLVGTIGAAAFTTYWYLHEVRPHQHAMAERSALGPKVDVLPWVQSDAGGLTALGSF